MAPFKKNGRSVFAVGLLYGSMTVFAYAQSNGGMKSVLVREKPVVAVPQPAIPNVSSPVSTSYPSLSDNGTVWFGDTPVLDGAGIETLQPQPTPLRSIEDKVVPNGSEIVESPPVTALPAPVSRPQDFMLDALGLNAWESAAGPRVKGVVAGGIANQIGFRPGDVITSVQGNEIYSAAELVQGLRTAVRSGEQKIPMVGIRTGRPFLVTANAEDLRQAAREQSNPPVRAPAMQMEPQIVRGNNPVVRTTSAPQPVAQSIAISSYDQRVPQSTTPQPLPQRPQVPTTVVPPPAPVAVTASSVQSQPALRRRVRTVRLANGQIVQIQETQVAAPQQNRPNVGRSPIGPTQQSPLIDRPVQRILLPVRRLLGR